MSEPAWLTYGEVARSLFVEVKTLQNLVSLHKLERRHVVIGRPPKRRRIAVLPVETVRALARLTRKSFLVSH